jgi:hypothetical protein
MSMKRAMVGLLGLVLGSCASGGRCNTDSCYQQVAETVDAFEEGEVVAWGVTEKQGQDQTKRKGRELASEKERK